MRRISLVLVLLLCAPPAHAAVAYVQSATGAFNGTTGTTVTFGGAVAAGNAIACFVGISGQTHQVSSVAMTGESFTLLDNPTHFVPGDFNGSGTGAWAVALNTTGGQTAITVTLDGAEYGDAMCHEISGVATSSAVDQHTIVGVTTPGTGANAITTGNVTTTANGEYIMGATTEVRFTGPTITQGTGYNARTAPNDNGVTGRSEDQVQTSAGAIPATFTESVATSSYVVGILTLKAPAGGAAAKPPCLLTLLGVSRCLD